MNIIVHAQKPEQPVALPLWTLAEDVVDREQLEHAVRDGMAILERELTEKEQRVRVRVPDFVI